MPGLLDVVEVGRLLAEGEGANLLHAASEAWSPSTKFTGAFSSLQESQTLAESALHPVVISDAPGLAKLVPGDFQIRLPGEDERFYNLHVPPSYNPAVRTPVVFAAEGLSMANAEGSMAISNGFNLRSDIHGFIAAYPVAEANAQAPLTRVWNLGDNGIVKFDGQGKDVQYFRDVYADIFNRVNGDKSRFFGVGHSAGGQYLNYLSALEPAGTFRGIGSINGTTLIGQALPRPGISSVIIHGTEDAVLPYGGGATPAMARLEKMIGPNNAWRSAPSRQFSNFVDSNQMADAPMMSESTPAYDLRYTAKPDGTSVSEYMVKGAGHTWPGAEGKSLKIFGTAPTRDVFDATSTYVNELGVTALHS